MKQTYVITAFVAAAAAAPSLSAFLDRRDDIHTTINIGKNTVLYGEINPQDALKRLQEVCPPEGPCNQTPINIATTSNGLDPATLTIMVTGHYPDQDQRDHFIDAIIAAVGVGTVNNKKSVCNTPTGPNQPPVCKDVTVYSQTGFVGIDRWNGQDNQGSMTATMSLVDQDNKWCDIAIALTGQLIGAINGIAQGFFGTISNQASICK